MKKFDQINVIPFIDIMLVLLAIVLMTATFIKQGKIDVTVPESSSQKSLTANDVKRMITIDAEGKYFLDDTPLPLSDLSTRLMQWEKSQQIALKVDAKADFQAFVALTDLFRDYELKNVVVITTKPPVQSTN